MAADRSGWHAISGTQPQLWQDWSTRQAKAIEQQRYKSPSETHEQGHRSHQFKAASILIMTIAVQQRLWPIG